MAIRCPRCGLEYDVALFAFGRTLHCTCGARVGIPPAGSPVAARPDATELRFAADAMLGALAKWLRVLGYDTTYWPDVPDQRLVQHAVREGRWLLTRDRGLAEQWWVERLLVLREENPSRQLRELAGRLGLATSRCFTRCLRCNELLEAVSREAVADRIPPRVRDQGGTLARCPRCGRVYWAGSHTARMRRFLERALEREIDTDRGRYGEGEAG